MAKAKRLHKTRFPGESAAYRDARDSLLRSEIELRQKIEAVAAKRRKLPLGGEVTTGYAFKSWSAGVDAIGTIRFSELFAPGKDTLVTQRVNFAIVAKAPIATFRDHARRRGWRHTLLLSASGNRFKHDYHAESLRASSSPSPRSSCAVAASSTISGAASSGGASQTRART